MDIPRYLHPVMVVEEIRDFYSDCSVMVDATYNLPELVGHMAHGPVYWDQHRTAYNAIDTPMPHHGGDVDIMNKALHRFYNNVMVPAIYQVGDMKEVILDERRGLLSIIYE